MKPSNEIKLEEISKVIFQINSKLLLNCSNKSTDEIIAFILDTKEKHPSIFEEHFVKNFDNFFISSIRVKKDQNHNFKLPKFFLEQGANINANQGEALSYCCKYGDFEGVKFLLTSPELKEHADIHIKDDNALLCAVSKGYLNIVKFLLTSPELKEHANISCDNNDILRWAINNKNLEMFKYLLSSPELKKHADIYANDASNFEWACNTEAMEILKYLVFDYKIQFTEEIQYIIDDFSYLGISKWRLKEELENDLEKNTAKIKKTKI